MRTTRLHPLAEEYLARLADVARALPRQERDELVVDLRGHLEAGLPPQATDADVRNLLHRLGSPEEIVAAAVMEPEELRSPAPRRGAWGPIEISAVVALTAGAIFLPLLGPLVGLVLVWASAAWTRREKVIATVLTSLPILVLALAAVSVTVSGPDRPLLNLPVRIVLGGAPC